ncbi:MAG: DNA gyrase inhibitor YacG [Myxococcota bacterium]
MLRRCPICRQPVPADARDLPFCSPRCKTVDLGRWLNEDYKISSPLDDPESEPPRTAEGED